MALVLMELVGRWRGPELSDLAPPFVLRDLAGKPVELASFRGRPVVLNFWATWCMPCRIETPAFARFASRHPEVAVIGIAADGSRDEVRSAAKRFGATYPVLLGNAQTLKAYRVTTFPTTVVVDAQGRVRSTHTGMMLDPHLELALASAMP